MPTPVIKSLASQMGIPLADAEEKWELSKKIAKKKGKEDNWEYIMGIFKKMIGESLVKENQRVLAGIYESEEEVEGVYRKYMDTVNMTLSELKKWASTKCSKEASLDRGPVNRNLELLSTDKKDWTRKHVNWANKTISFVNRMKSVEQGEKISKECPYSNRDVSLMNWAYDPSK